MPSSQGIISAGFGAMGSVVSGRRRYARALSVLAEISSIYARRARGGADAMSEAHTLAARRIVLLCGRNGATWVKLAQFFSCRPDVLPREYIVELQKLQNDGTPVDFAEIEPILIDAIGSGWRDQIVKVERKPVAVASIAQVHKATLADGREVALKVRLPQVKKLFDQDLKVFRWGAKVIAPLFRELDFAQITEQLLTTTAQELDFRVEADNLKRFASMQHLPGIKMPVLVESLSSEQVMVTEWVHGERLRDYLDHHHDRAAELLSLLFASYLQQVTRDGLYQADPHPGNFIVGDDGTITILDFGAIGVLDDEQVRSYSNLLYGLMGFAGDVDIGQLFIDAGFVGGKPDTLRELAMYVLSDKLKHANPATAMGELLELFREKQVRIPDSYVGIARVLITLGGFLMTYGVPFDWRPPEQRA